MLSKNIKMNIKIKVVILKTLPPSLEQAGSVLLPMVDYSLGGDGGATVIGVKNRASIWRSRLFSS